MEFIQGMGRRVERVVEVEKGREKGGERERGREGEREREIGTWLGLLKP
jgi:hypothetical protein